MPGVLQSLALTPEPLCRSCSAKDRSSVPSRKPQKATRQQSMASTPHIRRREPSKSEATSDANEANLDLSIHYNIVAFMLRVTQVRLFQLYYKRDRMARHRLSTGGFTALLAIRQNPGIRRGTLADVMATQRPNMTKL